MLGSDGYALHRETTSYGEKNTVYTTTSVVDTIIQDLKRQSENFCTDKPVTTQDRSDGCGGEASTNTSIAEAAALAASQKMNKPKPPISGGGIAQAAALAASKKMNKPKAPIGGGIAQAAALAASKKMNKPKPPISGGSIAQAAALAASTKMNKPKAPIGGGIAQAAALAASEKMNKPKTPMVGGIAEAAALAASKKMNKPKTPTGGGIAEAAALAASKKMSKTGPPTGIAEAAALSASRKMKKTPPPMDTGIAEAAALAASKKMSKTGPPTGIAEAAALAASKKMNKPKKMNKSEPPIGIAEAAARAASEKSNGTTGDKRPKDAPAEDVKPPSVSKTEEETSKKPTVSIAQAAATAAALKVKSGKDAIKAAGKVTSVVAMAAIDVGSQAAATVIGNMPAYSANKPPQGSDKPSSPSQPAEDMPGSTAPKKLSKPEPFVGGSSIAAAAASAALKKLDSRQKAVKRESGREDSNESEYSKSLSAYLNEDLPFDSVHGPSFLVSVMKVGADIAISNPRDLPSFYCLFLLAERLSALVKENSGQRRNGVSITKSEVENLKLLAQRLLLRSLAISNQATSIGMVGWLEYGSSNPLERTLSLPFDVLQRLACSFAAGGNWDKACGVLGSLVMRCEQHLPSYHPTTLSSMLDLAASVSLAHGQDSAKGIIRRASDLAAFYLSEYEGLFFDRCRLIAEFENEGNKIFEFDDSVDAISMIKSHATKLREEMSREFLCMIGQDHEVALLNHSLVGDALSVLANCLSAGEPAYSSNEEMRSADTPAYFRFWSMAYVHYSTALKGWIKIQSLSDPNACSAAYGVARCLRGLGRFKEATGILSTLASCLQESNSSHGTSLATSRKHGDRRFMFLHPDTERRSIAMQNLAKEQCLVMCVWQLAVLTVEQSPDECGRVKALSLLHSASKALRRLLDGVDDMDENTREVCLELYECVEQEARNLFEPVRAIRLPKEPKPVTIEKKPQITLPALTPMRMKRLQPFQYNKERQSGEKKALVVHFV